MTEFDNFYEYIEVVNDLIHTLVELDEKKVPIKSQYYDDAVKLKFDLVKKIVECETDVK